MYCVYVFSWVCAQVCVHVLGEGVSMCVHVCVCVCMLGWGVGSCVCTCVCELVSECMCVLGEVGSYADFRLSGDSRSESRGRLHIA